MPIQTTYTENFDFTKLPEITVMMRANGYLQTSGTSQIANVYTAWTSVWDETYTIDPADATPITAESEVKATIDAQAINGLTVVIV